MNYRNAEQLKELYEWYAERLTNKSLDWDGHIAGEVILELIEHIEALNNNKNDD